MGATSQYKHVCYSPERVGSVAKKKWQAKLPWQANSRLNGTKFTKWFATEREAAIQVDKWTIEHKLNRPLNILKPKVA